MIKLQIFASGKGATSVSYIFEHIELDVGQMVKCKKLETRGRKKIRPSGCTSFRVQESESATRNGIRGHQVRVNEEPAVIAGWEEETEAGKPRRTDKIYRPTGSVRAY